METIWHDLAYGLRMLRRSPGFTAVAVITLGLAIGANTAIFSVVNAVLLRPLGFSEPERLMTLWERDRDGGMDLTSYSTFLDLQQQSHSLEGVAVMSFWQPTLNEGTDPELLPALRVSRDFFHVLGVQPAYGRDFLPEEDQPKHNHVVILGNNLWRRRFGADPNVVGKPILVNGTPYTVVGILPANFESIFSTNGEKPAEIWGPLGYDLSLPWACRTCRHLRAIGRLKSGISQQMATAELDGISGNLVRDHPNDYSASGVILKPLQENLVGSSKVALYTLFGAVVLVLLIACANVASLLLSRATERGREIALRTALGASRGRLVRQLLTESLLLSFVGGALGVLIGTWGVQLLPMLGPGNLPRIDAVRLDPQVLLFTLALCMLSGLLFGLSPALQASRLDLNESLKEGGRTSAGLRQQRLRSLLVIGNVGLALMLLLGAGLLMRSLGRLLAVDTGFERTKLLTAQIDVSGPAYKEDPEFLSFYQRALARIQTLPGVESAGLVSQLPLGGNLDNYGIHVEEKPSPNPSDDPSAERFAISPDYLRTMRIPLRKGRSFSNQDHATAQPVVIVNETFARQIWPEEEALGERIKVGGMDGPWRTVVGIVGDVQHQGLDAPRHLQLYLPEAQWVDSSMALVVRTYVPPTELVKAVRGAVADIDKNQPVSKFAKMDDVVAATLAQRRFTMLVLGLFAITALVLAAVGIYGMLNYFVSLRNHEIGVRMALGAKPRDVLRLVLNQGMKLTCVGIVVGILGAIASTKAVSSLLYGVTSTDPFTTITAVVLLSGVASLACFVPAWRATKVDPMVALRSE